MRASYRLTKEDKKILAHNCVGFRNMQILVLWLNSTSELSRYELLKKLRSTVYKRKPTNNYWLNWVISIQYSFNVLCNKEVGDERVN